MSTVVLLAALAVSLGLVVLLWQRQRSETRRLRERLDAATLELQHVQTTFSRFAPQEVVDRVIARGAAIEAEKREVTVLFADLVDFTRMSERLDPDVLVRILNEYFARITRVISDHRGHVAKFLGDGLMALFGAVERNPWQANDAVHAALGMRDMLEHYNRELRRQELPELRVGIGIHCGVAVAGVIGTHELMEFTVIGSPVNLASRVERLTRVHGVDILVTAAVRAKLDPRFMLRELSPVDAPGVSEPVVTFAVEGFELAPAVRVMSHGS